MAAVMTLLVDVGFAVGASIPSTVFVIGSATQGIIGTDELGSFDTLSDLSGRELELNITRTSDRTAGPLITYNAGTATLKLLNMDGTLDPYVLEQAGLTAPGVLLRIRKIWGSTTYPVFYGYIDAWEPAAESPELGTVTVTATDGFSLLNTKLGTLGSPVGAGEGVDYRVGRVLDDLGWPADLRSLGTTDSVVQATSYGDTGLSLIQKAVQAEIGEFYIAPDGVAYLRGRHAIITDSRSATSQATFGSDRAGGEIPYIGRPGTAWDRTQLHTRVVAAIEGSSNQQIAADTTATNLYGAQYTVEETGLILTTDSDALSWAGYVLAADTTPSFRFNAITLNSAIEQLGISVMPHMLGREFGDRVTVVRRPPAQPYGSIVDSRELYIQGINHTWSASTKQWLTTWDLQPVTQSPQFVIGSATQGIIGTDVLAW